jgi:excisionase family DNA binding protein
LAPDHEHGGWRYRTGRSTTLTRGSLLALAPNREYREGALLGSQTPIPDHLSATHAITRCIDTLKITGRQGRRRDVAREVAGLLHAPVSTVEDWARRGILPSVKIGRRRLYIREQIEAVLTERT